MIEIGIHVRDAISVALPLTIRPAKVLVVLFAVVQLMACAPAPDLRGDVEDTSACPPDTVVGWGDSLTYALTMVNNEWQQAEPTWLETVGKDLGLKTENFGLPSQGSAEVAVRQGGLIPLLTLANNQIPAGSKEPIAVTSINPADGWSQYAFAGTLEMRGTLAGRAGILQHTVTAGVHAFFFVPEKVSAEVVAVPPNSAFRDSEGIKYRKCIQTIWVGENNFMEPKAIVRDVASMVHSLAGSGKFVVIGMMPVIAGPLERSYGRQFIDIQSWLMKDGIAAAGITPTAADTEAIDAGKMPPSLSNDGTHLTQAAYTAIGHHIAAIIKSTS